MLISYSGIAFEALSDIVNFVESKNTLGAGIRWLNRFEAFLKDKLSNPSAIRLCNNQTFQKLELRCLNFNDWVIAFSLNDDTIVIEAILHSSRITD